jgi:hypothetical protein
MRNCWNWKNNILEYFCQGLIHPYFLINIESQLFLALDEYAEYPPASTRRIRLGKMEVHGIQTVGNLKTVAVKTPVFGLKNTGIIRTSDNPWCYQAN